MEDSEDEADGELEPEPKSKSSSSKSGAKGTGQASKPRPKATSPAQQFDEEAERTPTPPPIASKRKAQEEASDRPQKAARTQPIEGSEDEVDDGDKQARLASPPADTPPSDDTSTIGTRGNLRKAAPGDSPIAGKRKSNDKSNGNGNGNGKSNGNGNGNGNGKDSGKAKRTPAKKLGLGLQSPTPDAIASGSGTTQETQPQVKNGRRGRQAKQELIDEADSVLGTSTPASTQRVTRQGVKRAQA
ncbi:hypothetical protein RSAG8_06160, partial [Rhizoctonia solani AG-8 WAC10335]